MKVAITQQLDFTLKQIEIVRYGLNSIRSNKELLLRNVLEKLTNYFNRGNDQLHYQDCESLDNEIRNWFLNQQDSKLQDRFANYLIELLIGKFKPLSIDLSTLYDAVIIYWSNTEEIEGGQILELNGFFCNTIDSLILRWVYILRKNIKTFAPELYKEHSFTLDRLLPLYNEEGEEIVHPDGQPQIIEPGLKLRWNCKPAVAGYIISELIRAGYLEPPTTNGELSLKKLAGICNQLFEVKGHTPSIDSWRNVVDPERNTLPDMKRVKLNLPDLDQLT